MILVWYNHGWDIFTDYLKHILTKIMLKFVDSGVGA